MVLDIFIRKFIIVIFLLFLVIYWIFLIFLIIVWFIFKILLFLRSCIEKFIREEI